MTSHSLTNMKDVFTNMISINNPQTIAGSGFCRRFEVTTNQSTMTNLSNSAQELWLPICGLEGIYEVSNYGNIKSLPRFNGKKKVPYLLRKQVDKYGYEYVHLRSSTFDKKMKVHRLVAVAFIPTTDFSKQVNHIDGNKRNNHAENLEWATNKENVQHAHAIGLRNMDHLIALSRTKKLEKNPRARKVYQFDLSGNFIKEWDCILKAAQSFGAKESSNIRCACRKRQRTAHGFRWSYTYD